MQKQKKILVSIIIIIVVAEIAVAGFFAYGLFFASRPKTDQTQTQTQNEIAGWKTYTNAEYRFEFQYPTGLRVFNDNSAGAFISEWNIISENKDGTMKDLLISLDLYSKSTVESYGWENGRNIANQTLFKNVNGDVMYITLENKNDKDIYNSVISSFKFIK
jgi:hypothetical protein